MALVIVLISHSGLSSSTSAQVLGSEIHGYNYRWSSFKKWQLNPPFKGNFLWCVFLYLPTARLSSFCTLELTPTILYKPCSPIPEEAEIKSGSYTLEIFRWLLNKIFRKYLLRYFQKIGYSETNTQKTFCFTL